MIKQTIVKKGTMDLYVKFVTFTEKYGKNHIKVEVILNA